MRPKPKSCQKHPRSNRLPTMSLDSLDSDPNDQRPSKLRRISGMSFVDHMPAASSVDRTAGTGSASLHPAATAGEPSSYTTISSAARSTMPNSLPATNDALSIDTVRLLEHGFPEETVQPSENARWLLRGFDFHAREEGKGKEAWVYEIRSDASLAKMMGLKDLSRMAHWKARAGGELGPVFLSFVRGRANIEWVATSIVRKGQSAHTFTLPCHPDQLLDDQWRSTSFAIPRIQMTSCASWRRNRRCVKTHGPGQFGVFVVTKTLSTTSKSPISTVPPFAQSWIPLHLTSPRMWHP